MLMEGALRNVLTVRRSIQSAGCGSTRHRTGHLIRDYHDGQKERELANPHNFCRVENTKLSYHTVIHPAKRLPVNSA